MEDQQSRFSRAKDLLLAGDLDADDYRGIKKETENKIVFLHEVLSTFANPSDTVYKLLKKYDKVLLDLAFFVPKSKCRG